MSGPATDVVGRWWWGSGASAVQVEGAAANDDWLRWERAGRAPESSSGNGFLARYEKDFALLAGLGLTDHRLSVSWARCVPQEGEVDREAVEQYRAVVAAGRAAGLRMWVCLLHTAIPVWFAQRGGFDAGDALETWLGWVAQAGEWFGDLAGGWMPFNTPSSYVNKAYLSSTFPPGSRDPAVALRVLDVVHTADFEAALQLRATGLPVCSNEALMPLYPADEAAQAAVAGFDQLIWGTWLAKARQSRYVGAFDLVGFSYYYATQVTGEGRMLPYPPGGAPGPLGYVPWADGIVPVLRRLRAELPDSRFVVAELGYGGDPGLDDRDRCAYLCRALELIAAEQDAGMRVEGVSLWTGIDNYEWTAGFDVPFGLFTRDRAPRRSAAVVRDLIRGR